jgi:hypothetical protein
LRSSHCAVGLAALLAALTIPARANAPTVVALTVANPHERITYLANARIWRDPAPLAPSDLLEGPPGVMPLSFEQLNPPGGLPCTFEQRGAELGGKSPKFKCKTEDGQSWRVKYWDVEKAEGNREVFAAVAASRLLWVLGFASDPQYPVTLSCLNCPDNPMEGTGPRSTRTYLGLITVRPKKPLILSGDDEDEGWAWTDLDRAIASLRPGPVRSRQRMHFDALTLLGVLIQHGDRKPEQQRLWCDSPLETDAGDLKPVHGNGGGTKGDAFTLFERVGVRACREPAIEIEDVGATFGGAGRMTKPETAKANLREWQARSVFRNERTCRGNLVVSMAAGEGGEGDPVIGEPGRQFLAQQLERLTPAQLRAIFTAARVEALGDDYSVTDPATGRQLKGAEAWTAVMQDKMRQIQTRRCPEAP